MPQKTCCVPTCASSLVAGAVLHAFPNPSTDSDKFHTWVVNAGLVEEDDDYIFRNRRICRLHFEEIYHYPKNRLSKLAVPTLHLPGAPLDTASNRPEPIVIDNIQPTTSTSSYSDMVLSAPLDSTSNRPEPIVVDDLQPTTSTHSYSDHIKKNSVTLRFERASTVVDHPGAKDPLSCTSPIVDDDNDPLQGTEGPISYTCLIVDKPSGQATGTKPIVDEPSPQAPKYPIVCTSPIMDNSPRSTVAQRPFSGSDLLGALKHNYSKFGIPEKRKVPAPEVHHEKCYLSDINYRSHQRQIRNLKQQIAVLRKRCLSYKSRLSQASKMSVAYQKVTKRMTEPAKIFTKMQCTQTHKKPSGRRFTLEEKELSLSLYKSSPESYSFLEQCFTLPSKKTLKAMLRQEKLEPYLTLDKNSALLSNKTLVQANLEPYLTLDKNCPVPSRITVTEMLAQEQQEPYLIIKNNSTSPVNITPNDMMAQQNPAPYLSFDKTYLPSTLPSNKSLAHKNLPYLTLNKSSPLSPKVIVEDNLAQETLQPSYLTINETTTLPSKRPLKAVVVQEALEPYLNFNKNSKTYPAKVKAVIESEIVDNWLKDTILCGHDP